MNSTVLREAHPTVERDHGGTGHQACSSASLYPTVSGGIFVNCSTLKVRIGPNECRKKGVSSTEGGRQNVLIRTNLLSYRRKVTPVKFCRDSCTGERQMLVHNRYTHSVGKV